MAEWTLTATGSCDDADEPTLARRLAAVLGTGKYGTAASQLTCSTHNGPLHNAGDVAPASEDDGDDGTAAAVSTVPPEASEAEGTGRSKDGSAGAVPARASRAE